MNTSEPKTNNNSPKSDTRVIKQTIKTEKPEEKVQEESDKMIESSYTQQPLVGRDYAQMNDYISSSSATLGNRSYNPYDPGAQTAFERYDPTYQSQRAINFYPTYGDIPTAPQQQHQSLMKMEPEESSSGPIYPKPVYYETPTTSVATSTLRPPGFSAINLSVKETSNSPIAQDSSSSNNITSSSPQSKLSPQVPSPPEQTLDLSVNRPISVRRSPKVEPVDFSGPTRPLGLGFMSSQIPSTAFSRESTPDSGTSHYLDGYRDSSGKLKHWQNILFYH